MLEQADLKSRAGNVVLLVLGLRGCSRVCWFLLFGYRPVCLGGRACSACFLPYSYANYKRNKRFQKFEELFPEAIDTLARAVRAGHAFTTALELIANEIADPVASEFRKLFEEQKFGLPVRDALINLTERVPLVDVKFFVTAVMLQRETGGNLAEILDNLVLRHPRTFQDHAPGAGLHRAGPDDHDAADGIASHHHRHHAADEPDFYPAVV